MSMRPRLELLRCRHPAFFRPTLSIQSLYRLPRRCITADEKPLPKAGEPGPGPNQDQSPHVSEEAAATGRITGEGGPEIEQGTPVQEILKRDKKSQEKAPKVLQEHVEPSSPKGSRTYSTSSRRRQQAMMSPQSNQIQSEGHIFGLPDLPLPSKSNLKHRYDPIIKQATNLMMQDGKLGKAQRNMALILNHLRTTSPPTINPSRPLLPGAPPASHLPLNPILYLTLAIDSVAPLIRLRSQRGAAGGGVALQIPIPLGVRQRRRTAVMWILDAASKRRSKASGRGMFAQKVAEEIVSIMEGRSSVWDRRNNVHKLGVGARANLTTGRRR